MADMTFLKTHKVKFILLAIVFIVAAGVLYKRLTPVVVETVTVQPGEITAEVQGTGTFEARYQTVVSAKIQGRIAELGADQNDKVKEGQLLARLDDNELRQEVEVAKASLDAAHAALERTKAEEIRAKAVLEQARRDLERYSSLQSSKSVSQETVEKSRERFEIAEAEMAKAAAAIHEANKQIIAAEEKLRFQEVRLADTRIVSPFDGLIVRRDRELGDIVVPGAIIFQLISIKELWVSAWVDESAMSSVAIGQPARIVFRSEPNKSYPGKVTRIAREVDRETREFKVDITAEQLPESWAMGQRAEVYIQTGSRDKALSLPLSAIVRRNGNPGAVVIENGKAVWRPITLGLHGLAKVEVTKGLSPGNVVITDKLASIIPQGRRAASK